MNPCPCGYYGHPTRQCTCTPHRCAAYLSRISRPAALTVSICTSRCRRWNFSELAEKKPGECSADIRRRVNAARRRRGGAFSRHRHIVQRCDYHRHDASGLSLTEDAGRLPETAFQRLSLSARAHDRLLKVARTIADLDNSDVIGAAYRGSGAIPAVWTPNTGETADNIKRVFVLIGQIPVYFQALHE